MLTSGMDAGVLKYANKVVSDAGYWESGFSYDFMLDRINEEQPFFDWSREPLSAFIGEIAQKTEGEVLSYDARPGGLVRLSRKIEDPMIIYDSFMNHLAAKRTA